MSLRNRIKSKDIKLVFFTIIITTLSLWFMNPFPQYQSRFHDMMQGIGLIKEPKLIISRIEYIPNEVGGCHSWNTGSIYPLSFNWVLNYSLYEISIENISKYRTLSNVIVELDLGIGQILNITEGEHHKVIGKLTDQNVTIHKIESDKLININRNISEPFYYCEDFLNFIGPSKTRISFELLPPLSSYSVFVVVNYEWLPLEKKIFYAIEYSWDRGGNDYVTEESNGSLSKSSPLKVINSQNENHSRVMIFLIIIILISFIFGIYIERRRLIRIIIEIYKRIYFLVEHNIQKVEKSMLRIKIRILSLFSKNQTRKYSLNTVLAEMDDLKDIYIICREYFPLLIEETPNKKLDENIKKNNEIAHWINQNFLVRLYAILEHFQIVSKEIPINKQLEGAEEIRLLRWLRNVFAHSSGRYNPKNKKHRNLAKKIIKHFKLDRNTPKDFHIPREPVCLGFFEKCKKYVEEKYKGKK